MLLEYRVRMKNTKRDLLGLGVGGGACSHVIVGGFKLLFGFGERQCHAVVQASLELLRNPPTLKLTSRLSQLQGLQERATSVKSIHSCHYLGPLCSFLLQNLKGNF